MPLSLIWKHLPESLLAEEREIRVHNPGWLHVETMNIRRREALDEEPITLVFIYRSSLVTEDSAMFAPVRDLLEHTNLYEVMGHGACADPTMMHSLAEYTFVRMTNADKFPDVKLTQHEIEAVTRLVADLTVNNQHQEVA